MQKSDVALSRRVRFLFLGTIFLGFGIAAVLVTAALRIQSVARDYVVTSLQEHYGSSVELGDLQISVFPTVHAVGRNLVMHFHGRMDLPPLVRVRRFTLDAGLMNVFRNPRRISLVRLEGLEIQIPPRATGTGEQAAQHSAAKAPATVPFLLDEVRADSAIVSTTPSDPSKDPLVFKLQQLTLRSVGLGQPMTFHAKLENPKPPGLIDSIGQFGPWNAAEPRETPVSGRYTFRGADLSVFQGISGILASEGRYHGPLDRLDVQGTADVPSFALDIADHAMPLHTDFQATVDGTSGDTVLRPVKGKLGNSSFEVTGSVARATLEKNKELSFDAEARSGRLEDYLWLAVKGRIPPMTGRISFHMNIHIPPGPGSVVDRLRLNGIFRLNGVKFTSSDVQDKLAGLSHRAQGDPGNHDPNVTSDFQGNLRLVNGIVSLPDLSFDLPGTHVALRGTYGLRSGSLDFQGTAKLEATVSQMTTGLVSTLLRPVDRLFRRDGAGTVLPIRISGTRGEPSFALDIGVVFKRR
jgi:hypothetical protein